MEEYAIEYLNPERRRCQVDIPGTDNGFWLVDYPLVFCWTDLLRLADMILGIGRNLHTSTYCPTIFFKRGDEVLIRQFDGDQYAILAGKIAEDLAVEIYERLTKETIVL